MLLMNIKELLPVGSVVLLKEGEKRIMIFGIKQTNSDDGKEYDYVGVIYPEGYIGPEHQYLFNHADIEKIFFTGYEDEERKEFLENLSVYYAENKTENQTEDMF